jgi:hypothetical protein
MDDRAASSRGRVGRFNESQAMALHEIIYVSLASQSMDTAALTQLLDEARVYNERHGITGMLLYHGQEFLQLIEGEEAEVTALYDAIWKDPRHQQMYKMWEGPIAERSFSSWAMGFVAPGEAALQGRQGYDALLAHGLAASSRGSRGKKILCNLRDDFLAAAH